MFTLVIWAGLLLMTAGAVSGQNLDSRGERRGTWQWEDTGSFLGYCRNVISTSSGATLAISDSPTQKESDSTIIRMLWLDSNGHEIRRKVESIGVKQFMLTSVCRTSRGGIALLGWQLLMTDTISRGYLCTFDSLGTKVHEWLLGDSIVPTCCLGKGIVALTKGGFAIMATKYEKRDSLRLLVSRLSEDGKLIWSHTFGSTNVETGGTHSLTESMSGSIIVSTRFGSTAPWIFALSSTGLIEWEVRSGDSEWIYYGPVVPRGDGGITVVGRITRWHNLWSEVPYEEQSVLRSFDISGNCVFSVAIGRGGFYNGMAIGQSADKGYVIAGFTDSLGGGATDVLLLKTDSSGKEQWVRTFGYSQIERAIDMRVCSDGGFLIAGEKDRRLWIIKTDSTGRL